MSHTHSNLATLIGSRICHDLISPIGAIHNGLELLELSGGMSQTPEMQLIVESCANARARVTFFRLAFGMSQGAQTVSHRALNDMITPVFSDRMKVSLSGREPIDRSRAQAVLLALLCIESALPRGGAIEIDLSNQATTLKAKASTIEWDAPLWSLLTQNQPECSVAPSQVQFQLLADLTDPEQLAINHSDTSLTLSF